ncbi:MAG: ComEC/Rec2 family competence protein [Bacteroidales bacterium]|nr:ComEC/Rec2 family competence protein [Bacteroidales bacterium]
MENRPLLRISIPFVAGVACGGVVCAGDFSTRPLALVEMTMVVLCLVLLVCGKRYDRALIPAMLFALGAFCYSSRFLDYARNDIHTVISTNSHHVISTEQSGPPPIANWWGEASEWRDLITTIRSRIDGIPFEHSETAPLLRALMTGDRSGLDRETVAAFRRSGASHLLALSGLHLGIIAMFLRYLLMVLGQSRPAEIVRSALLVGFCLAYTIACGASPSLVRALLFVILQQVAALSPGRRSSGADRLCLAATIQLAIDPTAIRSVAFQLSYLAMLGVVFIAPRLEAWYPATRMSARVDPMRWMWKAASTAIACQLTTAPVVMLRFGYLPQYFLLTNLMAMPVCELLLPVGIVALITTSAGGKAPALIVRVTDYIATLLLDILRIISEL